MPSNIVSRRWRGGFTLSTACWSTRRSPVPSASTLSSLGRRFDKQTCQREKELKMRWSCQASPTHISDTLVKPGGPARLRCLRDARRPRGVHREMACKVRRHCNLFHMRFPGSSLMLSNFMHIYHQDWPTLSPKYLQSMFSQHSGARSVQSAGRSLETPTPRRRRRRGTWRRSRGGIWRRRNIFSGHT